MEDLLKYLVIIAGLLHLPIAFMNSYTELIVTNQAYRATALVLGISSVCLINQRDFHNPLLGESTFPSGLLGKNVIPNGADVVFQIEVPRNSKVVYWATINLKSELETEMEFGDYTNSGITTADSNGIAKLRVKSPVNFNDKYQKINDVPNVFYRYFTNSGVISRVFIL